MTRLPKPRASPREMLHTAYCPAMGACRYAGDYFTGGGEVEQCRFMDKLLDFNDEMLLHGKAREFRDEAERVHRERVRGATTVGVGLLRAAEMTDPYEKIDAFDPELDEVNDAAEEHPDCPSCVEGREHYHRKADGKRVMTPQRGTTSEGERER